MSQLRNRSARVFVMACGLMAVTSGSFATAQDVTIVDPTPSVIFTDNSGIVYDWEVRADDLGFNIFDNEAGTIPVFISPGAPSNAFHIATNGNVSFGTTSGLAPLHVRESAQASVAELLARFDVSDDSTGKLEIRNGSTSNGIFHPRIRGTTSSLAVPLTFEGLISNDTGTNPVVAYDAAKLAGGAVANRPLVSYRNNGVVKVSISATGVVTATSFNPPSSRALKHDVEHLDSREAANALRQLAPVKYIYNDDETNQKRVGFIAEDVPEVVAASDRKSVPIMDVVALVTQVVKDQQKTIDEQRKLNEQLMKRLDELESRISGGK